MSSFFGHQGYYIATEDDMKFSITNQSLDALVAGVELSKAMRSCLNFISKKHKNKFDLLVYETKRKAQPKEVLNSV